MDEWMDSNPGSKEEGESFLFYDLRDAARLIRADGFNNHAGHLCGGRVRVVGRHGNEANDALVFAD